MASTLSLLDDPSGRSFDVMALRGEEALSELFSFRVAFLAPISEAGDAAEADRFARSVLGSRALLSLSVGASDGTPVIQPRYGMIASVHHVRAVKRAGGRDFRVDCTFVPRAWRLTLRKRSRVFQHCFVHEVVSAILHEHGLVHRWTLGEKYPRRQYCVQYQETDYDFVARLLAEEGLAFYFEHWPAQVKLARRAGPARESAPGDDGLQEVGGYFATAGSIARPVLGMGSDSVGAGVGGALGLIGDTLRGPERDPDLIEEISGTTGVSGREEAGEVFCFVDKAGAYVRHYADDRDTATESTSVRLHAESSGLLGDGFEVFDLVPTRRMAPEIVEQRDHDFRRPLLELRADATRAMVDEVTASTATTLPLAVASPLETPFMTAPLEVYEHHGEHDPPYVTRADAIARLDQLQADTHTAAARSHCPRLLPGHVFQLQAARPVDSGPLAPALVPEGDYATIRVRHTAVDDGVDLSTLGWDGLAYRDGRSAARPEAVSTALTRVGTEERYDNEIECVPAAVLYRPAYHRSALDRRPRATCETAVVVGPPGDEIHTDRLGRVKVQFHWDREGEWNEHSSCFLRVVQPWAGAGYGFQFLPRIGMEVLVTFIGGDPDRPVVTGCLYDSAHPHPEPLPERATRSAIRTQSSPGGGGFNEIVFEDKKNEERLTIGAQNALEQLAKGTHTLVVGEDQRVLVSGDQQVGVAGEHTLAVGKRHVVQVGENRSESVGGSATAVVDRHASERVQGSALQMVGGAQVRVVGHDDVASVHGTQSLTILGNAMTHIGDGSAGKGNAMIFAQGSVFATAKSSITLQGLTADGDPPSVIKLMVGSSTITIGPHEIALTSENIKITGTTSVAVVGHADHSLTLGESGATMTATPTIIQNDDGSAVKLVGTCAMLTAQTVELKSPSISLKSGSPSRPTSETAQQQQAQEPENNVRLELTHHNFVGSGGENETFRAAKLANVPCRVTVGSKVLAEDTATDDKGVLALHVPPNVEEIMVTLLLENVSGDDRAKLMKLYPRGLSFLVKMLEELPGISSADGKRVRLRNLGYETSLERIEGDYMDELTANQLDLFVADEELLASENLAQATTTRLSKLIGES